jgi:hypothetical protein
VNRPYGVDAGAGRNIAGLMARNVGATLAVARIGTRARFFAALRMTGTGDMRRAGSPRHTGPIQAGGVVKGETRSCPLKIASARSAGKHVSAETCAIENPTTASRSP